MNRIGRAIEMVVLQSRWLVAPFLLGLIVGLGALLYKFVFKLFDFVTQVRPAPEEEVIVGVLKLVDLSYYTLAQFAGGAHAQSHVYLPTNRPRGRCRSDNRSAKPLVGSRGDDVFSCPHCGMTHQFRIKSGYLAEPRYWPCIRVSPSRRAPLARQ